MQDKLLNLINILVNEIEDSTKSEEILHLSQAILSTVQALNVLKQVEQVEQEQIK